MHNVRTVTALQVNTDTVSPCRVQVTAQGTGSGSKLLRSRIHVTANTATIIKDAVAKEVTGLHGEWLGGEA